MTSRYSLYTTAQLSHRFSIPDGLPKGVKSHYNIHPTSQAPVIVNKNNTRYAELMSWGLVPKGAKNLNSVFRYKTYNVPSEKIFTKHSWDTAVRHNRCLIPANGFYSLIEGDERRAYYNQINGSELVAFAGIYSSKEEAGNTYSTFSIITSDSTHSQTDKIERLPIVLGRDDETRWLDESITDANTLYDMLRPTPSSDIRAHQVSNDIYSLKIDTPKLIESV